MRVLLVEDFEPFARSLAQGLREAGYAVDTAANGEEALTLALATPYDGILLDLMLPKLDGLTVLRRLRERGSSAGILVLTARDQVSDRVTGLDLGADDYLAKPFPFEELLARLRAIIWGRYQGPCNSGRGGGLGVATTARAALTARIGRVWS